MGRVEYGRFGLGDDVKETSILVQVIVLDGNFICKVVCGEVVSLVILNKGDLFLWGFGSCLQLGIGEDEDEFLFIKVEGKNLQFEVYEVLEVFVGG